MKRLEDFEDSPLVPALLVKLHEEAEKKLMDVSFSSRRISDFIWHWRNPLSTNLRLSTMTSPYPTFASSQKGR